VIGTNKKDAQETVNAIFADLAAGNGHQAPVPHEPAEPDPRSIEQLLRERQPQIVTYEGWEAIDRHERALGEATGRPRVKLTNIDEMLEIAAAESP
jgi:ferredoxin--NADP+ reductase